MKHIKILGFFLIFVLLGWSPRARGQAPVPHCAGGWVTFSGRCPNGRYVTVYVPQCDPAQANAIMARACGMGGGGYTPPPPPDPRPALESQLNNLNQQKSDLEGQVNDLQRTNAQLQDQVNDLNTSISNLQSENIDLSSENAGDNQKIFSLEKSEALRNLKDLSGSSAGAGGFDSQPGGALHLKSLTGSGSADDSQDPFGLKSLTPPEPRPNLSGGSSSGGSSASARTRTAKPRSPGTAWAYKGWEALQAHDWKLAAAWYKEALARDPNNQALAGMARYSAYAAAHEPNPISRQNGGVGVYVPGTPGPDAETLKLMDSWARANPSLIPPGHSRTIPVTTAQAAQSQ